MEIELQIKINEKLFLRNPEQSELGRKIIKHSIQLIHRNGFEAFTFRKLAEEIGTTEAGVYRYFENKHRLLVYIVTWYWTRLLYQILYHTHNINDPHVKLKMIITLLVIRVEDDLGKSYLDESLLHEIIITEGSKTYLTKRVSEDNKAKLFKPYKDLCAHIANIILEHNPHYLYPKSLASTLIEMAHFQNFFKDHLPSLTDFNDNKDKSSIITFLEDMLFRILAQQVT